MITIAISYKVLAFLGVWAWLAIGILSLVIVGPRMRGNLGTVFSGLLAASGPIGFFGWVLPQKFGMKG